MDEHRGGTSRHLTGNPWSAGCAETRSSGAEGGPGKRAGRDPGTAPRPDPYIIGKAGKTSMGTLAGRLSRYLVPVALPGGRDAGAVKDAVIGSVTGMPAGLLRSITWDQGAGMAQHAALTLATDIPVYFAHAHSPWERGTNENTNGLLREYFSKGTDITGDIRYLNTVADEINGRPRAILQFRTPAEVFAELLLADNPEDTLSSIASTG
jgi:transposase, IS30 family